MATVREPLYVYSIPPSIVNSVQVRPLPRISPPDPVLASAGDSETAQDASIGGSLGCALCQNVIFADVNEQRSHFRSDWHRYNVKMRLQNPNAQGVSEATFAGLVEGLEESLSGSASSSSEDGSESDDDAVATLLHKQKKKRSRSASSTNERGPYKTPLVWLQSPDLADTQLGIYTTLFPSRLPVESYPAILKEMQDGGEHGRSWALFMTAGGHFAGMVVRVSKPGVSVEPTTSTSKKGKGKTNSHNQSGFEIIAHKTFHRYTTRRKQGGSQSVNDNAKGPAKSAGAQLRRYGEQALRDDIRGLLREWEEELNACERIFIRASVSNRRIFLQGDDSVIKKGDDRLRTFPFPTRRPTLAELNRCLNELARVKVSHLTEEVLRAADEAYLAAIQPKVKPKPPPPPAAEGVPRESKKEKLSPEEEIAREKWRRLVDMIQKGRLDALQTFWTSILSSPESILISSDEPNRPPVDARIPDWLRDEEGKGCGVTLLQIAAAAGQEDVVRWLLVDLHADPTVGVPSSVLIPTTVDGSPNSDTEDIGDAGGPTRPASSRKAYDIAGSRGVRNVFRRTAYAHPDWWDWLGRGDDGAGVPSVLTPEMEEADQRKKAVKRKGLKERMKEREEARLKEKEKAEELEKRERERLAAEAVASQASKKKGGPQKLGGGTSSLGGGIVGSAGLDSMSPEMRARIERERRARAAEARLRG